MKRWYSFLDALDGKMAACVCLLVVLTTAMIVTSCGPSSQQKALNTSLLALQVADIGWSSYDKSHWNDIAATCASPDDCKAKNAAFVKQEADANKAFQAAADALKAAYKLENDKTIAGVEAAVAAYVKILTDLGVKGL